MQRKATKVKDSTNKCSHQFFREISLIEKLLHHIAYGEFKGVEDMVNKYPQLLSQTGQVVVKHTGLMLNMTPLRAAIYLKDDEIVALLEKHMDAKEIEKQKKAQFPEGYEAYKKAELERINAGFKLLENAFEAIADALNDNRFIYEKTEFALNHLRNYLMPKGIIETGEDINDLLFQEACKLYRVGRFGTEVQDVVAWSQIIGICEFYSPLNTIQALNDGLDETNRKKEAAEPQGRKLIFKIWHGGDNWVETDFQAMVNRPGAGLGFDYGLYPLMIFKSAKYGDTCWLSAGGGSHDYGSMGRFIDFSKSFKDDPMTIISKYISIRNQRAYKTSAGISPSPSSNKDVLPSEVKPSF